MYKYVVDHQFGTGKHLSSEVVAVFNKYEDAHKFVMDNNARLQLGTLRILEVPFDPTNQSINDIYQWTNPTIIYEGYWVVSREEE